MNQARVNFNCPTLYPPFDLMFTFQCKGTVTGRVRHLPRDETKVVKVLQGLFQHVIGLVIHRMVTEVTMWDVAAVYTYG